MFQINIIEMNAKEINIEETHIRVKSDIEIDGLKRYIYGIRADLKRYILKNPDFRLSLEPLKIKEDDLPPIIMTMHKASQCCDTGPMATVAGSISELCLNHLMEMDSRHSIVENGGDIALINNEKVLCGIYSNNEILGNEMAFELKSRKRPLGICTSSGKIGHSISFGDSDSVTVISKRPSIADGLATRIANDVTGETSEDKVYNGLETAENFTQYFEGVLIISQNNVGTVGKLPKIVQTREFDVNILNM